MYYPQKMRFLAPVENLGVKPFWFVQAVCLPRARKVEQETLTIGGQEQLHDGTNGLTDNAGCDALKWRMFLRWRLDQKHIFGK